MTRIVLFFLLFCCYFSMQISESDPHRNKTIVKVLAAYCNIGVQQTFSGVYDYVKNVAFGKIAAQLLNFLATQPVLAESYREKIMLFVHIHRFLLLKEEAQKISKQTLTVTQQDNLASKVIAELDFFYQEIYGIKTNNPDKYIGLLNKNVLSVSPLNSDFDKMRKIFRMKEIKDLPETYQYFHSRAKQYTSQFDQDGVIEAIFELIGTRNKFFVEVGGGSSYDNSYYLRTKKGWDGFLFNAGIYFQNKTNDSMLKMEMVNAQLATSIFKKYNISKELDFLSVDIDGYDYYVTKAILQNYKPAVISVEFNSNFPVTVSTTLKKGIKEILNKDQSSKIYGVSARGVYELGKAHGYSYVYHMLFTDIFLVRDDLLPPKFRGMKIEDTYDSFPLHPLAANSRTFDIMQIFEEKIDKGKPLVVPIDKIDDEDDKFIQKQILQKHRPTEQDKGFLEQAFKYLALVFLIVTIVLIYWKKSRKSEIRGQKKSPKTEPESEFECEYVEKETS